MNDIDFTLYDIPEDALVYLEEKEDGTTVLIGYMTSTTEL